MWSRKTYHECATELEAVSESFRRAHLCVTKDALRDQTLRETSTRGIEILRAIALAIRSEQDMQILPRPGAPVGCIKTSSSVAEVAAFMNTYRPPLSALTDFTELDLREGLNKVAHPNITRGGYFADADNHDLIVSSDFRGQTWLAVISVPTLCAVVKSLPDRELPKNASA